jgi:uncharacterized protein (DUF1501 family)
MGLTRRQFLERTLLATAALTAPHPLARALGLGPRTANAAPGDPILVLVQLEGGNDGLNMVIPASGTQQATYLAKRPVLGISSGLLTLDPDPSGTTLALHPNMSGLATLYDEGKLAVVNGVGYAGQSLSHFRSEDIWFGGIPSTGTFQYGWFGRFLDQEHPGVLMSVAINETLNPLFFSQASNVLAVRSLVDFVLPDDPLFPDLPAKEAALESAYGIEAALPPGLQATIGASGDILLGKIVDYDAVSLSWGSNLNPLSFRLAKRLKEVASIIRHDIVNPGNPTDARFFHVRLGGFDTHTNQATRHAALLDQLSQALLAFWRDMEAIGADGRVIVMTFSEFGRRVAENGGLTNAGSDHGAAAPLLVIGPPSGASHLAGGIHGALPSLETPDLEGGRNLAWHTDFRRVYATVMERWLGLTPAEVTSVLGAPFTSLPFLT